MKNCCVIATVGLLILFMNGCQSKPSATIEDLKTAANWELSGHEKYLKFADQALKDSLPQIATLFQATAETERIHFEKFVAILASLNTPFTPVATPSDVGTTEENIKNAIETEDDEFRILYPSFAKNATRENMQGALIAYNQASESEKGQRAIYKEALAHLSVPELLVQSYYVCPECGNIFASQAPKICPMCGRAADTFTVKSAPGAMITETNTKTKL